MLSNFIHEFVSDESGQGITEYAALLAFVAVLVGALLTQRSALSSAITGAMQNVVTQLNSIS